VTSIQQLIANVEAARQAVQDARAALADAIKDHAPHKVGKSSNAAAGDIWSLAFRPAKRLVAAGSCAVE
jgi:hypothetical protein